MVVTTFQDSISGNPIIVRTGDDVPQSSIDRSAKQTATFLRKKTGLAEFQGRLKRTSVPVNIEDTDVVSTDVKTQDVLTPTSKASQGDVELARIQNQQVQRDLISKRNAEIELAQREIESSKVPPPKISSFAPKVSVAPSGRTIQSVNLAGGVVAMRDFGAGQSVYYSPDEIETIESKRSLERVVPVKSVDPKVSKVNVLRERAGAFLVEKVGEARVENFVDKSRFWLAGAVQSQGERQKGFESRVERVRSNWLNALNRGGGQVSEVQLEKAGLAGKSVKPFGQTRVGEFVADWVGVGTNPFIAGEALALSGEKTFLTGAGRLLFPDETKAEQKRAFKEAVQVYKDPATYIGAGLFAFLPAVGKAKSVKASESGAKLTNKFKGQLVTEDLFVKSRELSPEFAKVEVVGRPVTGVEGFREVVTSKGVSGGRGEFQFLLGEKVKATPPKGDFMVRVDASIDSFSGVYNRPVADRVGLIKKSEVIGSGFERVGSTNKKSFAFTSEEFNVLLSGDRSKIVLDTGFISSTTQKGGLFKTAFGESVNFRAGFTSEVQFLKGRVGLIDFSSSRAVVDPFVKSKAGGGVRRPRIIEQPLEVAGGARTQIGVVRSFDFVDPLTGSRVRGVAQSMYPQLDSVPVLSITGGSGKPVNLGWLKGKSKSFVKSKPSTISREVKTGGGQLLVVEEVLVKPKVKPPKVFTIGKTKTKTKVEGVGVYETTNVLSPESGFKFAESESLVGSRSRSVFDFNDNAFKDLTRVSEGSKGLVGVRFAALSKLFEGSKGATSVGLDVGQRQSQVQRQSQSQKFGQLSDLKVIQDVAQRQSQVQRQSQSQKFGQLSDLKVVQDLALRSRGKFPKSPKVGFKPLIGVGVGRSRTFDVLVKRRGRFVKVGSGLTRGRGLKLGSGIARGSLAATFKLVPKGFTSKKDIAFGDKLGDFRTFKVVKGRKVALVDTFIQKRGKRLSSRGERVSIQKAKKNSGFLRVGKVGGGFL